MKGLFGATIDIMGKALTLRSKRNAVLSSNIANVDTPGYKSRDLNFDKMMETYLKEKGVEVDHGKGGASSEIPLRVTNPRHLRGEEPEPPPAIVVSEERGVPNNVDLDEEMAKLSANNIQYQLTTQMLIKKFEMLKTAITEGGKQ
ncbi:MAG: flagellar basal body rod protein FlgB [Thermodesulfobacteria bacterium]|nr:flagellar basal body rod protein FlgB [Thermodesulfobacteriota bacterium]